jgi:predicted membrane-bound spermidine synthase
MPSLRSPWINTIAGIVGLAAMLWGLFLLVSEVSLRGFVWAVFGFLVLGWAYFDRRKFARGTPESEVEGGRTIE